MPRALILDAVLYAAMFELVTVPFFGWLSDQWGRMPLYIGGAILSAALAFPLFSLIDSKDALITLFSVLVAQETAQRPMLK